MNAGFIQNATAKKLELRESWLAQENEYDIIDVSLCAGQTIVPGEDNVVFSEFSESLEKFIHQLSSLFPFITFVEKSFLHSTLLTIFNDSKLSFYNNKNSIIKLSSQISEYFNKCRPITIFFQDVVLTSNGSIILLGESSELSEFRKFIYNHYDISENLRKNIIHITLGRLLQNESAENMNDVDTFLRMKGHLVLPSLTVNNPKIIVSRDVHCLDVDTDLTFEFNSLS